MDKTRDTEEPQLVLRKTWKTRFKN